ncbi:MAG TPA: AbrB/MazE/SpoVT family DNA-binding domain-containing protein [Candidatus Limnocylindrales bacterium]|nr:AbrB/MazE/SpoVT family DNA-binding domain-containing protein [Candidatus Limnocylindrales bacterium]
MNSVIVTRHSQVTIPKDVREAVGITEGDRVKMRVEGKKIVIEKADEEAWKDCTDFLPEDFEKLMASLRSDSRNRFKRLGLVS